MTKTIPGDRPIMMPNASNFAVTAFDEHTRDSAARVKKINRRRMRELILQRQQPKQGEVMNKLDEVYAAGFMNKCAEHGVDPEALLKQAVPAVSDIPAVLGKLKGAVSGVGNRYAELLGGGNYKPFIDPLRRLRALKDPNTSKARSELEQRVMQRIQGEQAKSQLARGGTLGAIGAGIGGVGLGVAAHNNQKPSLKDKIRNLLGR